MKVAKSEAKNGEDFNTARTETFSATPRGKEAFIMSKSKLMPPSDDGSATKRMFKKWASTNSTATTRTSYAALTDTISY